MKERAFVLRRTAYRDADLIITLFGASGGKYTAIARQARASRKRFAGKLEPFCELEVGLGRSKGRLPNIAEARVSRSFPQILRRLESMTSAGHALAFTRAILPEQHGDPDSYSLVLEMLDQLNHGHADNAALLAAFKIRMLTLQGYRPELEVCALSGRRAPSGQSAYFDPRLGSVVSRLAGGGGMRLSGPTRDALVGACSPRWAEVAEHCAEELSAAPSQRFIEALVSYQVTHLPALPVSHSVKTK